MARNSMLPTFLAVNYTSAWGSHRHQIPVARVNLSADPVLFPFGQFMSEEGPPLGAGAGEVGSLIAGYVDVLCRWMTVDSTFTDWELWQVPDPVAWLDGTNRNQVPDVVKASALAGKVGLGNVSVPYKATQLTVTYRTTGRGVLRIQLMDARITDWNRNAAKDSAGNFASQALTTWVLGANNILRGRNNGKPSAFMQQSATLNEALRRAYRMD